MRRAEDLSPAEQALLKQMTDAGATVTFMSTFTEEGIVATKSTCCGALWWGRGRVTGVAEGWG